MLRNQLMIIMFDEIYQTKIFNITNFLNYITNRYM